METQPKSDNRRSNSVPNEIHNRKLLYNHNNNNAQRTTVTNTEEDRTSSRRGSINTHTSSSSSKTQNETTVINQFPMPPSTESNSQVTTTMSIPTKKLDQSHSRSSSSESSATIGHGVTHTSQMSDVNNNDHVKPAENKTSELPFAFPVIDEKKMEELSDLLQARIQKMALNEDLVLLQRTVDRMQQQRVTDLEEHLTRVKEQKKREEEILEQINFTKQRLELAIAGKLFAGNQQQQQQQQGFSSSSAVAADHHHKPKHSNSTNTTRNSKLKIPKEDTYQQQREENYYQRQRNRRSFPSSIRYENETNGAYFPDLSCGRANFEFMTSQQYPHHPHYGYPYDRNLMSGGFIDSPPRMRMNPTRRHPPPPPPPLQQQQQQQQEYASLRPRSKSIGSQWFNPDYMDPQDQQQHRFHQQQMHNNQPEMIIDLGYHQFTPTNRSRKSSLRSLRSDDISVSNNEKVVGVDLKDEPVNLTKEDPVIAASSEEDIEKRRQHPQQHRRRSSGGRFRSTTTTTASKSSTTRRPGAPPMMHPPGAFVGGPPPPHLFDRERMKMRPPPPPPPPSFGYNNMPPPPPPGSEYFTRMPPPQPMSPRFMAAFAADEQQQQQQQQQPSWNMGMGQWGPPPPQNMYGMPPPPPPPDNTTTNPGGGGKGNGLLDQQPSSQDQLPFNGRGGGVNRRFNPTAAGALGQQPPHSSMHHPQQTAQQNGYLSMYPDRIYL